MLFLRTALLLSTLLLACDSGSGTDGPDPGADIDSAEDFASDVPIDDDTPDDPVPDAVDPRLDVEDVAPDGPDGDLPSDLSVEDVPPDTPALDVVLDPDALGDLPSGGYSLRFYGNGGTYDDRVLIRLDDPETVASGPAVDVGATDFTIEFWMRARAEDNPNTISCGDGIGWVGSNIVIDRDRHSQYPTFGIGIADGAIIFAVCNAGGTCYTLCGATAVTDGAWHHVAIQRALAGRMRILVDGLLDATFEGPAGDISYPDDAEPLAVCPGVLCDYSDPFLVFGAEKHGYGDISYSGFLDEVRLSTTLRYGDTYTVPAQPFEVDAATVGLYHFDTGSGTTAFDSANPVGGPTHGQIRVGGSPAGPEWATETPFD